MDFSERLMELRKRKRMTQGDLADRLGVSRQSVSKWETGESFPDLPKLVQMADELEVSLDVLCARVDLMEGEEKDFAKAQTPDRQAEPQIPKRHKRKMILPLLLLILRMIAAGIAGYSMGKAGAKEEAISEKVPKNLRADNVQMNESGGYLWCSFYVNYYSRTADFEVKLSVGDKSYKDTPRVAPDGHCAIGIPTDKLSTLGPMLMELTVKENDGKRTITVADEITLTKASDTGEWEVSFKGRTDQ